jgi:polysaccharide pyruvyl transferase WcaK-like protein
LLEKDRFTVGGVLQGRGAPRSQRRVLLIGYYGKGNFGDDVLLTVTAALARRHLFDASLYVLSAAADPSYVKSMLGGDVGLVRYGERDRFDLVVHGGGGTFFDYGNYGLRDRAIGRLVDLVGHRHFVAAERTARTIAARPRLEGEVRLGLGIGVGRFSPGSPRLRDALPALLNFTYLGVRDPTSLTNLERLGLANPARLGADLAFLSDYWAPDLPKPRRSFDRPRLGIILRDWPSPGASDPLRDAVMVSAQRLARDYEITFLTFEADHDPATIEAAGAGPSIVWNPKAGSTLAGFATELARQDVLITSRAHGAICGAVLGVPSLIIEIDPKLRTVHEMLPNATRSVPADPQLLNEWPGHLQALRSTEPAAIAADVASNRARAERMVRQAMAHVV